MKIKNTMESKENLRQKKIRMKTLLSEAIAMLCKNSIQFSTELTVEGLLGITVDDEDVILININEVLQGKEAAAAETCADDSDKTSSLRTLLETTNIRVSQSFSDSQDGLACEKENHVSDVNSTAVNASPDITDPSDEQKPQPKRKQRRPKQYKEQVLPPASSANEDCDEAELWDNFSPVYNPVPMSNARCLKSDRQMNKVCMAGSEQDFVVERGALSLSEKQEVSYFVGNHRASESPYVAPSPPYKYAKDTGSIVKNENTILSIPSPKSIYGKKTSPSPDLKKNEISNNLSVEESKADPLREYIPMEPEYASDNENESESSLALSGEGNQIGDMPIDLSIDSPVMSRPGRRRGRNRLSSPHDEEINPQGAIRCPECRKWFESRIKYNRHKRSHRGIFTCRVCGRAYNRKDNMQRHYKLYHTAYFQKQGMADFDDISSHSAFTRDLDELEAS